MIAEARRSTLAVLVGLLLFGACESAAAQTPPTTPVLHVLTSGGFAAAMKRLAPIYEKAANVRISLAYGASMGSSASAIPAKLERGEPADIVILVREALDPLILKGQVRGPPTDLAQSRIAMAVKAGAPLPDISTLQAFRQSLLAAKSVAWSDSASGVFLQSVLFPRLGLADTMKVRGRMVPATPVGLVVARGDAEIGFQQLSELIPIAGIQIVGPIPAAAQKVTIFSAGIVARSDQPAAARALVTYLASAEAAQAIADAGMEKLSKP